jgi:hypothetical protein
MMRRNGGLAHIRFKFTFRFDRDARPISRSTYGDRTGNCVNWRKIRMPAESLLQSLSLESSFWRIF